MHKDPTERPQKGARKLTIDDQTWWFFIGRGGQNIPIWDPTGKKTVHNRDEITKDVAITPWDMRMFIDINIRGLSAEVIEARVKEREERIKKEKLEQIDKLRKDVYDRAKELVGDSNSLYREYWGGEERDLRNREANEKFLNDLMWLITHGTIEVDGKKRKPFPKDSWGY